MTANGSTPLAFSGSREAGVKVDASSVGARPCCVVVETPKAFIEIEADHFNDYLTHEGLACVLEARATAGHQQRPGREIYSKYCKTALNSSDGSLAFLETPVGLPIEIVPRASGPMQVGVALDVRILVGGLPAQDVLLRACHQTASRSGKTTSSVVRTDCHGYASIHLDKPGLWRLHTIAMSPHPEPGVADWESLWASLTFRLY